jgi:hypothetical protein
MFRSGIDTPDGHLAIELDLVSAAHVVSTRSRRIAAPGFASGDAFSIWQTVFEMACQWKIKPTRPVVSQIDRGRENQRLKSVKQIIIFATKLLRSSCRGCSSRSERPCSAAVKWLTCQPVGANSATLKILLLSIIGLRLQFLGLQTEPQP